MSTDSVDVTKPPQRAGFQECFLMRSTTTLKLALASTALMLVAACSKAPDSSDAPRPATQEAASPASAAREAAADAASVPDIGGVAAPGVLLLQALIQAAARASESSAGPRQRRCGCVVR